MSEPLRVGRRSIALSHPDRVMFPDAGLTKRDLATHYARVAPAMLPHVRGRPLALQCFPDGVEGEGYFLKNVPAHFPSWIATAEVPRRSGRPIRQVLAADAATLVYLVGQNAVTPHVGTSRADRLDRPDRIVFDLDPSREHFAEVRATARALGDLLRDLGFAPHAMTTGSRGLHVVVALRREAAYPEVHRFAADVGAVLVAANPSRLTLEFHRERRGERLYVDVGRNAYAQHAVAPYAVRALPEAPVATPLRWEELETRLGPRRWTVRTLPDRLAELGDPWRGLGRHARGLGAARRELERIVRSA